MKRLLKGITNQSLQNNQEALYISKSKALIWYLKQLNLDVLYDPILNAGRQSKLERIDNRLVDRLKISKKLMVAYCLKEENSQDPKMRDAVLEGISQLKLNARELCLYPFLSHFQKHEVDSMQNTRKSEEESKDENDEDISKTIKALMIIFRKISLYVNT